EVLRQERHLAGRQAEAEALVALGDARAARLIVRFLGVEQPLPGGIALLEGLGALARYGRVLGPTESGFDCKPAGCAPGAEAMLVPPPGAPKGDVRVVLSVTGAPGAILHVGESRLVLAGGPQDLSVPWTATQPATLPVRAEGDAPAGAYAFVPVAAEAEPPPPAPRPPADAAPPVAG